MQQDRRTDKSAGAQCAIKDGLSEDVEKDAENDLQKLHDKFIKEIDRILAEKQKEVMTV